MKPMLAGQCLDITKLRYPVLSSPKLDGVRAIVHEGTLVSRNLKPVRNVHTFHVFSRPQLEGLDGELIVGPHDATVFRRTGSATSTILGTPTVEFWVFDMWNQGTKFHHRQVTLNRLVKEWEHEVPLKIVPQIHISRPDELIEYEESCLNAGYEGIMIRSIDGPYKWGRSTENEGWLLKLKQFEDAEAEIIGFEERMHNGNELTRDNLGRAERSSHQENMVGRGDLGALVVRGINGKYNGIEFNIGTGFDDVDRSWVWAHKSICVGKIVKFKYFPQGSKDKPRFPVFLGFRELGT